MTAYVVPWAQVDAIERGGQFSGLFAPRRAGRHAKVGSAVTLYAKRPEASALIGATVCILRAPVLLDAEDVRSALPIDARDTVEAFDLRMAWKQRNLDLIAWRHGFPRWRLLTDYLGATFGAVPWALELVGWEPITPTSRKVLVA